MTQLVVKNEGGPGRFCSIPSSAWPTTNFKVSVLLSGWRFHVTQLVVKYEGGPGRFCIMPSAVWPTTNFKVIVLLSSWRLSCDTGGSEE